MNSIKNMSLYHIPHTKCYSIQRKSEMMCDVDDRSGVLGGANSRDQNLFFFLLANMEELQTLVLTTLDRDNVIEDTKNLKSTQGDALDQLAVLGVLNSLKSKDVCGDMSTVDSWLILTVYRCSTILPLPTSTGLWPMKVNSSPRKEVMKLEFLLLFLLVKKVFLSNNFRYGQDWKSCITDEYW